MLQIVNMRDQSELEYKEITRLRQLISIKDGWVVFIGPDRQIIWWFISENVWIAIKFINIQDIQHE